jgi:asparagine synthase (glutamine-hydrolysing)
MCGIAGLFFKRKPDRGLAEAFTQAVELHQGDRGPDDFDARWVTDRLIFFHNRLAIIDPGRARQPMADREGIITFNGEVYNFAELKFPGETYRFASDTEVLLKGLNRQGTRFLERTHCMFAFAYYNYRSTELLLARDRVGIKQLYYIETNEVFAFASTLNPLMLLSAGETDEDAVFDYYLNRAVKAPRTIFRDIRQLEAGHLLRFDSKRRVARIERWWSPSEFERSARDETEIVEEIDRLLRRAVNYRLVSDVPVGLYLSGGIDSGLIAAIASETASNLQAFSVAMPDSRLDESRHARAIAERYGLRHHVIDAEPQSFLNDIERWARIQDDVVADPSALMLYQLSKVARDAGFKVMLSGEGADELFGGYNAQLRYVLSRRYHGLFRPLKPGASLIDWMIAENSKLRQFVHQLITGPSYYGVAMIFEPVILNRLLRRPFEPPRSVADFAEAIRLDLADRLPNDLLTRTDRATMGASIEARVPFLSHEIVDYSLGIDESLLINGHTQKYLLKKLAERYMPASSIHRRKIGFDLPLADWLRGPLRPKVDDLIESSWQGDLIDLDFMREIVDLHRVGTIDAADKIWAFMMLELNRRSLLELRRPARKAAARVSMLSSIVVSSASILASNLASPALMMASLC